MKQEYEYWLAAIPHLSCKKKCWLREQEGSAESLYNIEEKRLKMIPFLDEKEADIVINSRKTWHIYDEYKKLRENKIRMYSIYHLDYPDKLKELSCPPYALYVKGRLPKPGIKSIAIVGARGCTSYGEQMAIELGEKLARAGIQIISGMARGIDGAGQRGALNAGGHTFAVLGCGVDVCYPREHFGLYRDIQINGGIISEYPPGTNPLPTNFPARNRIISGLSEIVAVIEARKKSGSLITADMALEQGRDVYALPGPVTSPLSQGCNALIKQGAGILLSAEELLIDMGISYTHLIENSDKNKKMLETPENIVYSCLDLCPKNISQIINEVKLSSRDVLEILTELQLKGLIKEVTRHFYVKAKECPVK